MEEKFLTGNVRQVFRRPLLPKARPKFIEDLHWMTIDIQHLDHHARQ